MDRLTRGRGKITEPVMGDKLRVGLLNFDSPQWPAASESFAMARLTGHLQAEMGDRVNVIPIHDVSFDCDLHKTVEAVCREDLHLLGVSLKHGTYTVFEDFLRMLKTEYERYKQQALPTIVAGNILPTLLAEKMLQWPGMQDVIVGRHEGEDVLTGLAAWMLGQKRLDEVPNLVFYNDGQLVKTRIAIIKDLDRIGPPAYSFLDRDLIEGRNIHIEESRGCPWGKCTFCYRLFLGDRFFSPEKVMSGQIRPIVERWSMLKQAGQPVKPTIRFGIVSENFLSDRPQSLIRTQELVQQVIDLRQEMLASGEMAAHEGFELYVSLRVPSIYRQRDTPQEHQMRLQMLQKLVEVGCMVFIGIESGAEKQRERYHKGATIFECEQALRILMELGIGLETGFIMFDPLVTVQEIAQNLDFIEKTGILHLIPQFAHELGVYYQMPMIPLIREAEKVHGVQILGDLDMNALAYSIVGYVEPEAYKIRTQTLAFLQYFGPFFRLIKSIKHGISADSRKRTSQESATVSCYHLINQTEFYFLRELVRLASAGVLTDDRISNLERKSLAKIGRGIYDLINTFPADQKYFKGVPVQKICTKGQMALQRIEERLLMGALKV